VDGRLLRVGLLRSIAWLAPISAAQYAWIVVQRVSTPEPQAAKQAAEMR
jgi:cardiolipin synthase